MLVAPALGYLCYCLSRFGTVGSHERSYAFCRKKKCCTEILKSNVIVLFQLLNTKRKKELVSISFSSFSFIQLVSVCMSYYR